MSKRDMDEGRDSERVRERERDVEDGEGGQADRQTETRSVAFSCGHKRRSTLDV